MWSGHGHPHEQKQVINVGQGIQCTYQGETGQISASLLGLSGHVSLQVVLLRLDGSQGLSMYGEMNAFVQHK